MEWLLPGSGQPAEQDLAQDTQETDELSQDIRLKEQELGAMGHHRGIGRAIQYRRSPKILDETPKY